MGGMSKYKIGKFAKNKDKTSEYQHLATFKKNCQYCDIKNKNRTKKCNDEM